MAAMITATAAAAAGTVTDIVSAGKKSDAAGQRFEHAFNAADAGNKAAERAEKAALPSPQELRALEGTLRSQEQTIQREQKLIEAVDPALMEAGKQAFDMMRGKETEMLGPIRRQRERQKQQMKETLRRQLGPGFETSSAGIEAMTRFDTETADLMANTQQKAIMDFLGVSQNAATLGRQSEAGAQGRMTQVGQVFGNIQGRQVEAHLAAGRQFLEGGKLIDGAAAGKTATAGGEWDAVGRGFGQVAKFAGFAAGAGMGGAGAAESGGAGQIMGHTEAYDKPRRSGWQEQ